MIDLHPVKPEVACGTTREIFDEVQGALALPWVPALFQVFAMYPEFLERAWEAAAPLSRSRLFLDEAEQIQRAATAWAAWYAPAFHFTGDRARPLAIVEAFLRGDARLAILAAAYLQGLDGELRSAPPVGMMRDLRPEEVSACARPLRLVRPEEATPPIRSIYRDIERSLGLPLVTADYQSLAAIPGALEQAWPDLRLALATAEYRSAEQQLATRVDQAAQRVGLARRIDRLTLRFTVGLSPAALANLSAVVHMFRRELPGLCLQMAMLRAGFSPAVV